MQCIYPYFTKYGHAVPCGKCPTCLQRRTEQWVFRLQQEQKNSLSSHFLTLTYNEEFIRKTPNKWSTLQVRDLQLFFKRLRKRTSLKLSYYAVGEYGSSTYRPHYHVILFNQLDQSTMVDMWRDEHTKKPLGHIYIDEVNSNTLGYTAGYIQKKRVVPCHPTDDRRKEFSIMSKDLGQAISPLKCAIGTPMTSELTSKMVLRK